MCSAIKVMVGLLVVTTASVTSVSAALAEIRCETRTQVCNDVRMGARVCQVTICKDGLGTVTSTDVIVLKDDAPRTAGPGPKVSAPKVRLQDRKR